MSISNQLLGSLLDIGGTKLVESDLKNPLKGIEFQSFLELSSQSKLSLEKPFAKASNHQESFLFQSAKSGNHLPEILTNVSEHLKEIEKRLEFEHLKDIEQRLEFEYRDLAQVDLSKLDLTLEQSEEIGVFKAHTALPTGQNEDTNVSHLLKTEPLSKEHEQTVLGETPRLNRAKQLNLKNELSIQQNTLENRLPLLPANPLTINQNKFSEVEQFSLNVESKNEWVDESLFVDKNLVKPNNMSADNRVNFTVFGKSVDVNFGLFSDKKHVDNSSPLLDKTQSERLISDKNLNLDDINEVKSFDKALLGKTLLENRGTTDLITSKALQGAIDSFGEQKSVADPFNQNLTKPISASVVLNHVVQTDPTNQTHLSALVKQPLNFYSRQWQADLSAKVVMMRQGGIDNAEIQIEPAELGPITLKLSQQGHESVVSVHAAHAQTRELLEQNQERLKEMLASQGLELSHFDVSSGESEPQDKKVLTNESELLNQVEDEHELASSDRLVAYSHNGQLDLFA